MEFRDALKALRREIGITQVDLANALHINTSTVSRWAQAAYLDEEFAVESDVTFGGAVPRGERPGVGGAVAVDNSILEQFMPACVVINEKNELEHTYGDITNVIHMPHGKYSNNLFDLIAEALKIPVSTLLKESRDKKKKSAIPRYSFCRGA